jgi:hypothetical protein
VNMPAGACYETTVTFQGIECTGATGFEINGTPETCGGTAISLPAMVKGGYCFQFGTGDPTFAAFSFY